MFGRFVLAFVLSSVFTLIVMGAFYKLMQVVQFAPFGLLYVLGGVLFLLSMWFLTKEAMRDKNK